MSFAIGRWSFVQQSFVKQVNETYSLATFKLCARVIKGTIKGAFMNSFALNN